MLIFENFISRYENVKSRDSSSTQNSTRHRETVREGVRGRAHLPSPPLTHWELITIVLRLLRLDLGRPCHADRSTCWDKFQLSVVRRLLQIQRKPCLQTWTSRSLASGPTASRVTVQHEADSAGGLQQLAAIHYINVLKINDILHDHRHCIRSFAFRISQITHSLTSSGYTTFVSLLSLI